MECEDIKLAIPLSLSKFHLLISLLSSFSDLINNPFTIYIATSSKFNSLLNQIGKKKILKTINQVSKLSYKIRCNMIAHLDPL